MTDNQQMSPDGDATKRHRYGDVREDGRVFVCYRPHYKNGEYWVSPARFALLKFNATVRYHEAKEMKPKKPLRLTLKNYPQFRVRAYRPRPHLRKRELTQKEFDTLPFGPYTAPTMTTEKDMTIIPNYSKYAITPEGTVHRVQPATRGRTAGLQHRVTPVIHPKGHQWCVQITDDNGKRKRIPIKKLMEEVYGNAETIS
jgi:hypothetical protein